MTSQGPRVHNPVADFAEADVSSETIPVGALIANESPEKGKQSLSPTDLFLCLSFDAKPSLEQNRQIRGQPTR